MKITVSTAQLCLENAGHQGANRTFFCFFSACHTAAAAFPIISGEVPPISISPIHWYSFTSWWSETVCRVQQVQHVQLWVNVYIPVGVC